ncbi:hypothetical protein D3C73_1309800 [compost metagenome]
MLGGSPGPVSAIRSVALRSSTRTSPSSVYWQALRSRFQITLRASSALVSTCWSCGASRTKRTGFPESHGAHRSLHSSISARTGTTLRGTVLGSRESSSRQVNCRCISWVVRMMRSALATRWLSAGSWCTSVSAAPPMIAKGVRSS